MNTEIAALKGHLSDLKMRKMDLELKIDANIKAAKQMLAASAIKPIDQIDVEAAVVNLKEAAELKHKRAEVITKIGTIELELS